MAHHSQSLLPSAESVRCPVIPASRTWKTERVSCCKLAAQRCPEAILSPKVATGSCKVRAGWRRVGGVVAVRLGEWWEEAKQRSCRCWCLSGLPFDWVPQGKRRGWWRGCWWPVIQRVMDGEGGRDWGATVASACLRVWVKQSVRERDLKAQSERSTSGWNLRT